MPIDLSQQLTYYQAEPFIKNSHLVSHLFIYRNEEVLLFTDKALLVYSYQQMLRDQAALVHIVEYDDILEPTRQERTQPRRSSKKSKQTEQNLPPAHMDQITQIFNTSSSLGKPFGQRIFTSQSDLSSNILLKPQHFLNRLRFLGNIRLQSTEISPHGDLLLTFANGQAVLLIRDNQTKYFKKYEKVMLNELLVKGKVEKAAFVQESNRLMTVFGEGKLWVWDYLKKEEVASVRCEVRKVNGLFGYVLGSDKDHKSRVNQSQRVIVVFKLAHKVQFHELNIRKKRLTPLAQVNFNQQFIQTSSLFTQTSTLFISTSHKLLKIDLTQLSPCQQPPTTPLPRSFSKSSKSSHKSTQKQPLTLQPQLFTLFSQPQQLLYITSHGDYLLKCKQTSKQYLTLVTQTSNGILIGVTCKKQGNYKDGQLVVGVRQDCFDTMVHKGCVSVARAARVRWEYLDFSDLAVLCISQKIKKEVISKLGKLFSQTYARFSQAIDNSTEYQQQQFPTKLQIYSTYLTKPQFQSLVLNLGSIFQSKQSLRQKQITQLLHQHMVQQGISPKTQNLKQLCMFTHQPITYQSELLECEMCELYGIRQQSQKSREEGLRNGSHRCYFCLNQMKVVS